MKEEESNKDFKLPIKKHESRKISRYRDIFAQNQQKNVKNIHHPSYHTINTVSFIILLVSRMLFSVKYVPIILNYNTKSPCKLNISKF